MAKITVVTDSTAYLPKDFVKKHGIKVVPLKLNWDNDTFRDNVDITAEVFYQRLEKSNTIPTTSQPSSGDFMVAFDEAAKGVDALVAVLISSGISGTVDSALMAKKEFTLVPLEVVDSKVAAAGLAIMVKAIATAAEKGSSVDDVVKMGKRVFDSMGVYFVVDTLKYLHKGGRIGGASAFLGSALDLKPILYLSPDGKVEALEKVRTKKKAVSRLIDLAVEKAGGKKAYVGIMHANALEGAQMIKEELEKRMDLAEIDIYELSPAIGTHTGPGTLGIAVHTAE
jgi:DegV family protein with EDD domain